MNRQALAFWAGLAAVLVAIGLVGGRREARDGEPYDPASTGQDGTAALVTLLGELGHDVGRGLPGPDTSSALLLDDRLTDDQRVEVEEWVRDGGRLVVSDLYSPFAPPVSALFRAGEARGDECPLPGLDGLEVQAVDLVLFGPSDRPPDAGDGSGDTSDSGDDALPVPPLEATGRCFSTEAGDYLQTAERGAGRVVALGGAGPLTNRHLDEVDNAVLAVQLLTSAGSEPAAVAVLHGPVFTPGSRGLRDLLPTGLTWSLWQLAVAFALFVIWRARRFGPPVTEPQPVELPGSLLVRATGELQRRSGGAAEASVVLRADLDRRLRRSLKVTAEVPSSELAAAAARVGGLDPGLVARALSGPPAASSGELSVLVADIDLVNRSLADGGPAPDREQEQRREH